MNRKRVVHWLYVGLYFAAIVVVARLVFNGAWDKGVSWTDRIGLAIITLAALALLKRLNPDLRGLFSGRISTLSNRKTSEITANLFLTVIGIAATAIGLMAPRPATEEVPGFIEASVQSILGSARRLEAGQNRIEKALKEQAQPDSAILQEDISGIWGEDNCSVTYSYVFKDGGLIVASLKTVPGLDKSVWKGGNLLFNKGVLTTTTIVNDYGLYEGGSVVFTYKREAGVETLERNDKHEQVTTRFLRCTPN